MNYVQKLKRTMASYESAVNRAIDGLEKTLKVVETEKLKQYEDTRVLVLNQVEGDILKSLKILRKARDAKPVDV